ncbi:replication initiator protein [Flyfo microvirus Tbat2_151]|nr:replication initiator protein [Flyfo microvirus Tbat2_151]
MLCANPYSQGMHLYPCGQCMPCRVNKRREWTHRIMLEASLRSDNAFITLTYGEEFLPIANLLPSSSTTTGSLPALPTLHPPDVTNWLKRLRKAIYPLKIRYFVVGEYGDQTERPHYHVALFGFPTCRNGRSRYSLRLKNCCEWCDLIRDTWKLGQVDLGTLTPESSQYIAGYVTKKMTSKDDKRLMGRHPEFSRMSLKPGIGADMMFEVASTLMALNLEDTQDDVPSSLRHGSRSLPLGRYLRKKLRTYVGKDEKAPQSTIEKMGEKLLPMREAARNSKTQPSFKKEVVDAHKQGRRNQEAKSKVFKKRGSL